MLLIPTNVIKGIAEVLKKIASKENGCAARWGGEEFMVLLPECKKDRALEIAERIRTGFAEMEFDLCGHQTVSLGVIQSKKKLSVSEMCNRVDTALYIAKKSGKNCIREI